MKKNIGWAISITAIIFLQYSASLAYEGKVHSNLNEAAVNASDLDSVLQNQLGIENGIDAVFKKNRKTKAVLKWVAGRP